MEDINYIDAAADNLIPEDHKSSAYYVAKDTGIVCGIEIAKRVFELAGGDVDFKILLNDGTKVNKGDIIAERDEDCREDWEEDEWRDDCLTFASSQFRDLAIQVFERVSGLRILDVYDSY